MRYAVCSMLAISAVSSKKPFQFMGDNLVSICFFYASKAYGIYGDNVTMMRVISKSFIFYSQNW